MEDLRCTPALILFILLRAYLRGRGVAGELLGYALAVDELAYLAARRGRAALVGERTRSQVVQVIGKKIVLYKEGKDEKKKIELPR